jgi:hypothetical protein
LVFYLGVFQMGGKGKPYVCLGHPPRVSLPTKKPVHPVLL